jgi:hypothetical protein
MTTRVIKFIVAVTWLADDLHVWCLFYYDINLQYTVEPGYNDIGLYNTSPITSDIQWYLLIPYF